jgi:hypothetical protein
MKKSGRLIALSLILMLTFSVPAFGWSDTGHMAIAFVAYQQLTPQTRTRVNALIRLNPRFNIWVASIPAGTSQAKRRLMLFMIAATWADQIKGDGVHQADGPNNGNRPPNDGTAALNIGYSDTAMHKYWHFIDLPFSPDGTALQDPPIPNAETQIAAFRAVLASDSPDPLKSYDLVWLLHLVGDVHQPLHATARFIQGQPNGDDGGNLVDVRDGQNRKRLHAFWDGLLGTSKDPQVAIGVGQGLPTVSNIMANNLDAAVWIQESFEAAKSQAYRNPPIGIGPGPFTVTQSYRNTSRTLARRRAALAGARLARILNNELR